MSLLSIPTLDELMTDPGRARELPPELARDLLARLVGLQTMLLARVLRPHAVDGPPAAAEGDRLLTPVEAGRKLGRSTDWLYRHANKLPFTVRDGRFLRFSLLGIERHIRQRQGR